MASHSNEREREPVPLSQRLLLRPEEAAALLGLGRTTIYELLRAGALQTVHIGRATRIPARDLQRWIELHLDTHDVHDPGYDRRYDASHGASNGASGGTSTGA